MVFRQEQLQHNACPDTHLSNEFASYSVANVKWEYRGTGSVRKTTRSFKKVAFCKNRSFIKCCGVLGYDLFLRRERTQGAPRTFEFIDSSDQTQELGDDLDGVSVRKVTIIDPFLLNTRLHPIWYRNSGSIQKQV